MKHPKIQFIVFVFIALALEFVPIVRIPLKWFETYFHEISHGLVALATGGQVLSISLNPNGSGLCISQGGMPILITLAGYLGAVFWGWLIIGIAQKKAKIARLFSLLTLALFSVSLILWARDILTILILVFLLALNLLMFRKLDHNWLKAVLMFIGISVILNAIKSPWYLIDGQARGDGASLANLTYIPELIWIIIWLAAGLYGLYSSWRGIYASRN
ncbi:M50 family metallopeptidase [Catenovulum sp. 2E275]|uniref:M50 family metallopeptidase n=1 Tax=Catenovulum sp. 2E275 TaxID=2980497 RepID=UPI0021CEBB11|nr:M50 family metallopeptidase [Catenovulum sp. 2E275]MCU4676973.1 M50 family metallopeptidase [Catenovulum sp. 2E275]